MIPTNSMKTNKFPSLMFVFDRKHEATTSKAKERKQGLVQLVVSHERKRKYIGTGIRLYTDQWDALRDNHVVNSIYANEYNARLRDMMADTMALISDRIKSHGFFSLDMLSSIGSNSEGLSVVEYGRKYVAGISHCAKGSLNVYTSYVNRIERYGSFGLISSVTLGDIERFDATLVKAGLSSRTRVLTLDFLGRLLTDAYRKELIKSNPFESFNKPSPKSFSQRKYLVESEIVQIVQADLPKWLHIARDLFLIQCHTGMCYADTQTLNRKMIVEEGGHRFIVRGRVKTHVAYRIMLLPIVEKIMERYGWECPKIAPNTYNRMLKRIGTLLGFDKKITSHVGRHTFATWALSKGVPIEIVSKMLGHSNITTTQIYAKILAKDVDNQFMRLADMMAKREPF